MRAILVSFPSPEVTKSPAGAPNLRGAVTFRPGVRFLHILYDFGVAPKDLRPANSRKRLGNLEIPKIPLVLLFFYFLLYCNNSRIARSDIRVSSSVDISYFGLFNILLATGQVPASRMFRPIRPSIEWAPLPSPTTSSNRLCRTIYAISAVARRLSPLPGMPKTPKMGPGISKRGGMH